MSVAVVVPWRPAGPDRGRAWAFVNRWYATCYPTLPVHVALAPSGAWCKARAAMPAISASSAHIIVLADADVICDGLGDAVQAVRDGAPWSIPHRLVKRLTKTATTSLLDGADPQRLDLQQRAYPGVQGGGIVVAARETLLDVPLDQRFTNWGQEDTSHALALHCLKGPAWRGTADLFHLWHPPADRLSRVYGSDAGKRLYRRYSGCRRDPAAMRALVNEGRADDRRNADESAVHPHAA